MPMDSRFGRSVAVIVSLKTGKVEQAGNTSFMIISEFVMWRRESGEQILKTGLANGEDGSLSIDFDVLNTFFINVFSLTFFHQR